MRGFFTDIIIFHYKQNAMKKNVILLLVAALTVGCLFTSCSRSHRRYHDNNIDVSISESRVMYKLQAYYNEDKTSEVQRYINKQIEPNGLFSSGEDHFDVNTQLGDRTKFYIKSSPGRLIIKINKRENSYQSVARIKNMCEGLAGIIRK